MKRAKGGFLTIALFAVAATLLTFSVVGSSRAALTYFSETYGAQVSMFDIGVTLVENDFEVDQDISWRDYLQHDDQWNKNTGELVLELTKQTDDELQLGHKYKEELRVKNSGNINEYVRVTLYKYWEKKNEATGAFEKAPELDSSLIDLHLITGNGWRIDDGSTTEERTVLYYDPVLAPGDLTPAFTDTLEVQDEGIEALVTTKESTDANGNTVIETIYTYNDTKFIIKADVDAVQDHNDWDAKMSAWGTTG